MNTISKILYNYIQSKLAHIICMPVAFIVCACDFNGPWSFYPEEREIYTGIYTYGYIIEGESPEVCFSKTYELEESSAENFAFYDSAHVVVKGSYFFNDDKPKVEMELELVPNYNKPKCFYYSTALVDYPRGVVGETYTLEAYFKWDSAGKSVESKFSAEATIPEGFNIKGINVPQKDGSYKWRDIDTNKIGIEVHKRVEVEFLEYPNDVNLYGIVLDYNESMGGILLNIDYDIHKGGESMNTTMSKMLGSFVTADSNGYLGYSLKNPLENRDQMGYEENRVVAGINMLDTIFIPNMTLPLGNITFTFYATDKAYYLYKRYLMQSFEDPTVMPKSNIKNGMGVFSGMAKLTLPMIVTGEGVGYDYMAINNCVMGESSDNGWDTKACRLYQDVFCSGFASDYDGNIDELYELNEKAYNNYRAFNAYKDFVILKNDFCFAPAVKAALMLETLDWSKFLPEGIDSGDKQKAYNDGLKRYCVASNFRKLKVGDKRSFADCTLLEKECLESKELNNCKEYLWQWCADRNWDIIKYPQCGSGLVSRYYLQEQKSKVLKNVINEWCSEHKGDAQCER